MEMSKSTIIKNNYERVLERVDQAALSVGRIPSDIKVVVVTKGHPLESVQNAFAAGLRVFGENYAEEGLEKKTALSDGDEIEWHMIGHIQSRKSRLVSSNFGWVHSLDSYKLAKRLDRFSAELGRRLPVLLELNVSGERTKYGWSAWRDDHLPEIFDMVGQIVDLPSLDVCGLMTMAPFFENPDQARPYFQRLRELLPKFSSQFPQTEWRELSMGMSADFQSAVKEGATIVRIGTAIMGSRLGV